MSDRVAIVGAALSDCGRVDDKSAFDLHFQATSRAIADSGLAKADIDGFMSQPTGFLPPIEVAEHLGIADQLRVFDSTNVGGSSWLTMLAHAVDAIQAGSCEVVVLSYASTARADLKRGARRSGPPGASSYLGKELEDPWGATLIAKYALSAARHAAEYGTTVEQLAEIAVSTRFNASLNPDAYYRDPITVDDVNSAPMMADPLTKLHCCIRSDGGGAIVVTSEARARDCRTTPVWILGSGHALSHVTMSEWPDFTESPCAKSGETAFSRAGLKPSDVDVCELYDSFTPTVLLTLEGLGFCKAGEGGAFVEDGRLRVDGQLPTNTDGGGLSACHPGQRGMFLLVEATRQLRGTCDARQVPSPQIACVSGTGGWFSSSSTVLLGVDDRPQAHVGPR